MKDAIGTNGYHFTRKAKSSNLPPFLVYERLKLMCESAMTAHATVVPIPDIANNTTNKVFAATTLVNRDTRANPKLTKIAFIGMFRLFNFPNTFRICPLSLIAKNIREQTYNPEFATDKTAVKITKFMISDA